jgi:hypothetical protein
VRDAIGRAVHGAARNRFEASFRRSQVQAAALLERFAARMGEDARRTIEGYVALRTAPWLERRVFLLREGILKTGLVRNAGLLLRV